MRAHFLIVPLTACVLASTALSGAASAASAAPAVPAVLAKNPLYKAGKFALKTCEEPPTAADVEVLRLYVEEVSICLDKAWGPLVKKAGLPYGKPKVKVSHGEKVKTSCGTYVPDVTDSVYCAKTRTVHIMVSDYGLTGEIDRPMWLDALSAGWALHVQNVAGVTGAVAKAVKKASKRDLLAMRAKHTLQTLCLTGAFTGSVWDSLGHSKRSGHESYIDRDARYGDVPGFGTAANRAYWTRRGFEAESPSACNTFTAPAVRVK
ncbi:neutral zinc metallopeptidase [Nonomuraea sp. PA05]|uniref:neutral zinc metallopeptidase n=1 Tax=Nonomuraea sp. PA05 TaxID=2604466 RepID=UPI001651BF54|nr:neutral zinc metallopeptidase [Nonomuraea sp. PA05]